MMTEELKQQIIDDLAKIGKNPEEKYIFSDDTDDWQTEMRLTGRLSYIYVKNNEFYKISFDESRGTKTELKDCDIKDFLSKIYSYSTYEIAREYALKNRKENVDIHRIIDIKQLELLNTISEEYYKKRLQKLRKFYQENPELYKDNLRDDFSFELLKDNR